MRILKRAIQHTNDIKYGLQISTVSYHCSYNQSSYTVVLSLVIVFDGNQKWHGQGDYVVDIADFSGKLSCSMRMLYKEEVLRRCITIDDFLRNGYDMYGVDMLDDNALKSFVNSKMEDFKLLHFIQFNV